MINGLYQWSTGSNSRQEQETPVAKSAVGQSGVLSGDNKTPFGGGLWLEDQHTILFTVELKITWTHSSTPAAA